MLLFNSPNQLSSSCYKQNNPKINPISQFSTFSPIRFGFSSARSAMNPPGYSAAGSPTTPRKKEIQLQGPRPPQLRVSQESRKIKKPPPHPQPVPPGGRPPLPPGPAQWPQPLIIYDISPKVIHVAENNFMSVVQRLTGLSSAAATDGDLSPAARLATIEKASPRSEREREINVSDMMDLAEVPVELGQIPGILSPAPATLAPIPTGYFSPAIEHQSLAYSLIHELSPHWPSPSALFSAPLVSPISSPNIFNNLFDF
ncbi:unnamed protein product [Citrullus colocynthis]|uniref:VQ domain-containing protein n=1 Tax=Citrullus colocynthis TaxID=252529 RepID=A0ABP0Y7C0_9ROSI